MAEKIEGANYKLVVIVLTVITMSCILSDVLLVALNKKPPEALINLAFSTGGALGGILTNPAKEDKAPANELETLGGMAAKSIIDEAMKQMRKAQE
jgi:hypothetical protein